jgi:spermidine/putrescine transport system permease protein
MSAADSATERVPARRRRAGWGRRLGPLSAFAGPGAAWMLLFILIPYGGILVFSFYQTDMVDLIPAFDLSNLERVFTDSVVRTVFLRTLGIALAVTVLTFLFALPLAYYAAFYVKHKHLFVFLIVVPMWVSYIVRLYSWRLMLGEDGVVNGALTGIGVLDQPLSFLLFSPSAVILTLTYVYFPFMFVALFSVMEGLDRSHLRAASDLYASPWRRFVRVTLPLTKPGIAAGVMLVFPLAFGDYIAPGLVGGPNGQMFGNLIQNQFGTTFNYPFGAALALVLLTVVLAAVALLERWRRVEDVRVY